MTAERLPRLRPDRLDADQRRIYDGITTGPRASGARHFALTDDEGGLHGPFNAMLLSPPISEPLQELGAAIRYRSVLTPRIREMAILAVAAHHDSAFERYAHESVGRAVGLTDGEIEALRAGAEVGDGPEERSAIEVVRALLERRGVPADRYEAARSALGERALFELSTLVGYYTTLAMQMELFAVGAPDGAAPERDTGG